MAMHSNPPTTSSGGGPRSQRPDEPHTDIGSLPSPCTHLYHTTCMYTPVSHHMHVHTCITPHACTHLYHTTCMYTPVSHHMHVHTCITPHACTHLYHTTCMYTPVSHHMHVHTCITPHACTHLYHTTCMYTPVSHHMHVHTCIGKFAICLEVPGLVWVVPKDDVSFRVLVVPQANQNDVSLVDPYLNVLADHSNLKGQP